MNPQNDFYSIVRDGGTWTGGDIFDGALTQFARPFVANEDSFAEVYFLDAANRVQRYKYDWSVNTQLYEWGKWSTPSQSLHTADTFKSAPAPVALNGSLRNRPIMVFGVNSNGHMLKAVDSPQ
jgi:hypothetical protein